MTTKDIFKLLKNKGFNVYYPAQKEGECKQPYIVIKNGGSNRYSDMSCTTNLIDLMCYVPKHKYSELEDYVTDVENVMKEFDPVIQPTYFKTVPFYDDSIKAHMISIQYKNYKKIERG